MTSDDAEEMTAEQRSEFFRDLVEKSKQRKQENFEREEFKYKELYSHDRLDIFCAIVRRLYQAEIENRCTYRYILYDIFGFDPEAYSRAQDAGFLALHNSIMNEEYDEEMLRAFCKLHGIDDVDKKIEEFNEYLLT